MTVIEPSTNPLLEIAVPLLDSHLTSLLSFLWRLSQRILTERSFPSDYTILEYEACLELVDAKGKEAVATKREKVKFLQNNVIAYRDVAWGEGDIFADYRCSPGVAVDRYKEGHRYQILISLRETKHRGEITEFHIRRTIRDGFLRPIESFQHDVSHQMAFARMSVVFPKTRLPKEVVVIEQNSTRTMRLGPEHEILLPDGRLQVAWQPRKPRLFESYIIRWTW